MITKCKALWQKTFGDTKETVDAFFATAYKPENIQQIWNDEKLISALYWLDWYREEEKFAYIYAVATDEAYRGKGYGRALMEQTHRTLQSRGYAGAIVVPAEQGLVNMYKKLGYQTFYYAKSQEILSTTPCPIAEISWQAYAEQRKKLQPNDLQPSGAVYGYLATFARFYQGEDALFCVANREDTAYFQEFIGNYERLPGIISSLNARKGIVRVVDERNTFAMYYPLTEPQAPTYFALPLD